MSSARGRFFILPVLSNHWFSDEAWYLFFMDYQSSSEHVKQGKANVSAVHVEATFPDLAKASVDDFSLLMQGMLTYQPDFARFCVRILDHMTLPGSLTIPSLQSTVRYGTVRFGTVQN